MQIWLDNRSRSFGVNPEDKKKNLLKIKANLTWFFIIISYTLGWIPTPCGCGVKINCSKNTGVNQIVVSEMSFSELETKSHFLQIDSHLQIFSEYIRNTLATDVKTFCGFAWFLLKNTKHLLTKEGFLSINWKKNEIYFVKHEVNDLFH